MRYHAATILASTSRRSRVISHHSPFVNAQARAWRPVVTSMYPISLPVNLGDPGNRFRAKQNFFWVPTPASRAEYSALMLCAESTLIRYLRDWLEWYPEKVLFGTDLFPGSPEIDWEEIGYMTSTTGRQALALALTEW